MDWYLKVWKQYAQFDGRARRQEFWMFTLFNLMAVLVLAILGGIGLAISEDYGSILFIPLVVYYVAAFVPTLAVTVRRFHDTGKSGWVLLLLIVLGIIPFVGIVASIIQLVFVCTDSDQGTNEYGPSPKYPDLAPAEAAAGNFTTINL